MISLPRLLMNRESALPETQQKIEQALEEMTARNLACDRYFSETINLPQGFLYKAFICRDFLAIYSLDLIDKKIKKLALWSLINKSKVWDIELNLNNTYANINNCLMSECGLVLLSSESMDEKTIILEGKVTGVLPKYNWYSVVPIGNRILGSWNESHNPIEEEGPWLPDNSNHFFGEWNEKGEPLSRYKLDYTLGRWTHEYTYDKNFWIRLSGSNNAKLASIIEIVDRPTGTMKTYELPLNPNEERFTSACIAQNQLFYGIHDLHPTKKFGIKHNSNLTICIYNIVKGVIIDQFPTGQIDREAKNLVANQKYAAWLDYKRSESNCVKYLDIFARKIEQAIVIPSSYDYSMITLNITGSVLSVTYPENNWNYEESYWQRKVIDMSNGVLKSDVRYKRSQFVDCLISNGNMVITDVLSTTPRIYIENFANGNHSDNESPFRIKST